MDGEGTNEAYRECLRNHAASLGSYATDGCGEFTLDSDAAPGSLKCAACGCHRNFHRKVIVVLGGSGGGRGGGGGGGSSSREGEAAAVGAATTMDMIEYGSGEMIMERSSSGILNVKKRVRSKFTVEQKEKMLGFAEKLGWRIRRKEGEDDEIERFCRSVGVSRQVFKVWMHNHKSSSSSLSSPSSTATNTTVTTGTTSTATANASSLTDQ